MFTSTMQAKQLTFGCPNVPIVNRAFPATSSFAASKQHKSYHRQKRLTPVFVAAPERSDALATDAEQITQQIETSPALVVTFVATWCRKCIYLKPKLQKLMQDEFSNIPLVLVDVNAVPADLIRMVGVSKMPTIQLWMGGKKVDEMLGGHSGQEVIAEVREMIQQHTGGSGDGSNGNVNAN